jgi:ribonuclease HII
MASNLILEKKFKKEGWKFVIGIDESGRGPLAGPVVAVAVIKVKNQKSNPACPSLPDRQAGVKITSQNLKIFRNLKDSKKLSPRQREKIYEILNNHSQIIWARGLVSAKVIDKINILEATKLAMRRAVKNLEKKLGKKFPKKKTILIIDGNQKIGTEFFELPVIKADETVFLCIWASVLAKVHRDRLMRKYHKLYPSYNFEKHKGYPTKLHKKKLKKYGPCLIHRKSFKPVTKSLSH